MHKRNIIIRIIAIILCAIMILGIVAVALNVFAADTVPSTGSSNTYIWFIVAGCAAIAAIIVLAATQKKSK